MSKAVVLLTWDKLWNFNTTFLDKISKRLHTVGPNIVKISLSGDLPEYVDLINHPKNNALGKRRIIVLSNILADHEDFIDVKLNDRYTLIGIGNTIVANLDPIILQYNKNDPDYKSTKKITWLPDDDTNIKLVVRSFGHLLSKPKLDSGDNILDIFNKNSLTETTWLFEKSIIEMGIGSVFQAMRKNYCYVDKNNDRMIINIVPSKNN